jgi:hypothetical protein
VLLSVAIASVLMLVALETRSPVQEHPSSLWRGLLWGTAFSTAAACKLTAGLFIVGVLPALLWLRYARYGFKAAITTFLAALGVSIPALVVLAADWSALLRHASAASFGSLAQFYSDGLSTLGFIGTAASATGMGGVALVALTIYVAFLTVKSHRSNILVFWPALILLAYAGLVTVSVNRDARFLLPIWIALPFCLAALAPPTADPGNGRSRVSHEALATAVAGIVAFAVVNLGFAAAPLDLSEVARARGLLAAVQARGGRTVSLATDDDLFNIETLILAKELDRDASHPVSLETVVYDIVAGRTIDQSIASLGQADVVAMELPVNGSAPEWANRNAPAFQEFCEAHARDRGRLDGSRPVHIFYMRERSAGG